jgi:hypothetical protein
MDTQLNFLESEKRERNETNMAKIVAISHNPEEQVPITEALTGSLQNATVIPVRSGIAGMKKIRAERIRSIWELEERS